MMPRYPWREPGWVPDRSREVIWTNIATVPLAFWAIFWSILYLALFTDRNAQVVATISALVPILLGLGVTYAAVKPATRFLDMKYGNGSPAPPKPP